MTQVEEKKREELPSFEEFKKKREEWFREIAASDPLGRKRMIAVKLLKARISSNPYYKIFKSIFSDSDEEVYEKCKKDAKYREICLKELGLQ